ncbi:MAG TPA: sigma-70 family RNA polymerase sigma factor [Pyrinomonadaceae bacterium]|nr:sigma-70 family RNA polymerase sigma factor [Pyrinomonadaceae bacterium]
MNQIISGVQPARDAYQPGLIASREASDHMLAQSAACGAMPAIGYLYERHRKFVYTVCRGMTHNTEQAEDLTQEVFIHLVRKIGLFRGESQFTTWLHRLTVNLVLMHFRRMSRRREYCATENYEKVSYFFNHRQTEPAHVVDRIALDSAVRQLPPGCKSVFLLYDVEGRAHDEIARQLGCSVGNSKAQLHKARKKLRRLLRTEKV